MKFRYAALILPVLLLAGFGCAKPTPSTTVDGSAAVGSGAGPGSGTAAVPTDQPSGTGTPSSGDGRKVTISLKSQSDEKEWGTAVLTDLPGNQTRIDLSMANAPKDEAQTVAIHSGACSDTAAQPQYALNPVVKGSSSTTLNVNLTALLDKTGQSIRVKLDAVGSQEPLAACGNLN